jgi:hypothetical protein
MAYPDEDNWIKLSRTDEINSMGHSFKASPDLTQLPDWLWLIR